MRCRTAKGRADLAVLGWSLALACCVPAAAAVAADAPAPKPNVIVIITDDQGYRDVGFNGSREIRTPNIDRIAREGVRFTRGYVTFPVCGPSRAGLLTGRYQSRFGFDRNPEFDPANERGGLPRSEEILPEIMKRAGYATMAVGKWHMGTHPSLQPQARGFDEFYGFLTGGHRYYPEELTLEDLSEVRKPFDWYRTKLLDNGKRVPIDRYLTDALSDRAAEFVSRKAEASEPFFLYLAYNAPHQPLQATSDDEARLSKVRDPRRRTYLAMIAAVDRGVGRVLDALDRHGVARDTLVVFLSDNGGVVANVGGETPIANNGPLRAGKASLYEGGIRVPFAMRWPARLPSGRDYSRPVSSMDVLATVAAHLAVPLAPGRPLDGVDLVPYVTGARRGDPHRLLFWRMFDAGRQAVLMGDTKLIIDKGDVQLFDLSKDPSERIDRVAREPARVAELEGHLQDWLRQLATEPAFETMGKWPARQRENKGDTP